MHKVTSALRGLWHGLFDSTQPRWRYLGRALLLDLPVTLPLAFLVAQILPTPTVLLPNMHPALKVLVLCVLGPAFETGIMVIIFGMLRWFTKRTDLLIFLSALVWAALHSASSLGWGFVIFWPFVLFSACYLTWEKKSQLQAVLMTTALHGLHNLLPAVMMILDSQP